MGITNDDEAWPSLPDDAADAAARRLLIAAGIEPRPDLAGAVMWAELRQACFFARMWSTQREGGGTRDIDRVAKVEVAARRLAEALADLSLADEPTLVTFMGAGQKPEHEAAGALLQAWSNGPAAVAALARDARLELERQAREPPTLAQAKHATGAAFLIGHALPVIYQRHVGGKPTFTPASDLARSSAFLRLARVVMAHDGLPPMTDNNMMKVAQRWAAAASTWTGEVD